MKLQLRLLTIVTACLAAGQVYASQIDWNGFGSAYMGQNFTDEVHNKSLRAGRTEFGRVSRIGLNVGSSVTQNFEVAAQFVASGGGFSGLSDDKYDLNVNWAFATFKPMDNFRLKLGRQLFPNWLAAEYTEVGYLLPYREIPGSIYVISPFKNFDGVLADYTFNVGVGNLTVAAWTGTADMSLSNGAVAIEETGFYGAGATLAGDGYKVRAQVSHMNSSVSASGTKQGASVMQTTVGANYDKHNIVAWAEYANQTSDGAKTGLGTTAKYLEDMHGFYVLGGYRIGAFLPRVMYTNADFTKSGIATIQGKEDVWTVGVNYTINSNAILKAEYEMGSIDKTKGGVQIARDAAHATTTKTDSQALFVGVDFIF